MTFENPEHSAFVPNGDDVRETAKALVATADKHDIPQTEIQVANDGFYISERLADLLYEEDDEVTVGEVAADLAEPGTENYDPAGTIARDREQIALAESLAETDENVLVEEAPDTVTNEAIEDTHLSGAQPDVDYEDWDYPSLKVEVGKRGLSTDDQKADTLIAALKADDEAEVPNEIE